MRALVLVGVGVALLAVASGAAARMTAPPTLEADLGPAAESDGLELPDFAAWADQLSEEFMPPAPTDLSSEANRRAWLLTLQACEGTLQAGGYRALYGSRPGALRLFDSFADHPRIASRISLADSRYTSAAGAYQAMAVSPIPGGGSTRVNTWDRIKSKLALPDFSPASQDAFALELTRECGALADVDAGRVLEAARKCKSQWASLPGANYAGQGMRSPDFIVAAYRENGGELA